MMMKKQQRVVVIEYTEHISKAINEVVDDYNAKGWDLKQVCSHANKGSYWTLLFERKISLWKKN